MLTNINSGLVLFVFITLNDRNKISPFSFLGFLHGDGAWSISGHPCTDPTDSIDCSSIALFGSLSLSNGTDGRGSEWYCIKRHGVPMGNDGVDPRSLGVSMSEI